MKKSLVAISGVVLGVLALVLAVGFFTYKRVQGVIVQPVAEPTPIVDLAPTPDPLAPFSVALMGYGGGNHDGGFLTDTIMLAYVKPRDEKITLFSIPRDTWVSLPLTEEASASYKINAAYAIGRDDRRYPNKPEKYSEEAGGGEMAKYAIEQVTGIRPDHFVAVSFAGFQKSIDSLDGVIVNVQQPFDDYYYPIKGMEDDPCGKSEEDIAALTATVSGYKLETEFECRYEHLRFEEGKQLMPGERALKFVRSRHSAQAGGDFSRTERQRALLVAVKDRVISVDFLSNIIPFISEVTGDMQMDISIEKIKEFIGDAGFYSGFEIESQALTEDNVLKPGRSANGQYILMSKEDGIDNWDSIHVFVAKTLSGELEEERLKAEEASGEAEIVTEE